jgi:7,8-dihydroneopterin aldolase/epimerase/oxygenase
MDHIVICDLEVAYRVGVSEVERANSQRLLLSLDIEVDVDRAIASDNLDHTIDYYAVTRRLLEYGKGRSWRLIEKLAADIAQLLLTEFHPRAVTVEVRKFIIPETRYVAVRLRRAREEG